MTDLINKKQLSFFEKIISVPLLIFGILYAIVSTIISIISVGWEKTFNKTDDIDTK